MKEKEFAIWLEANFSQNTAKSRFSNCKRIEAYEGNLDQRTQVSEQDALLKKFTYSKADQQNNKQPKHSIPIIGDIYNGTATLKRAAKLYFEFRSGDPIQRENPNHSGTTESVKRHPPTRTRANAWPDWTIPTDKELFELIQLSAKYIKFLSTDIVYAIVKDNDKRRDKWIEQLKLKGIDPNIYLWDKSPCAFPGVRRYVGSKEIAYFRGHAELADGSIPDAISLDDNDYPKQIWAFLFTRKEFRKSGPTGYSLAHLADHKVYKNRLLDNFEIEKGIDIPKLYGLYTCPTNTVYIPTNFLRPTDFSPILRQIIFQRAFDLYGGFCNLLPPGIKLRVDLKAEWNVSDFKWAEPVGDLENIEPFLEFRKETMVNLFE